MSRKKKKSTRREPEKVSIPWWKRAWAKLALIPLSTLLALWGAGSAYKFSGAEELRARIYEPLYADVRSLEESVQALSVEKLPTTQKLAELRQRGAFERIPSRIQSRILKVSDQAQTIHTAVMAVNEITVREMSSRIIQIRTEESDRIWLEKASQKIREMSSSGKGISDSVLFTFNHAGRSRSIDVRDPARPVIAGPGGPSFTIGDWVTYPQSIGTIDKLWTDLDYLYFNEVRDAWYYRLTREDVQRANTDLAAFLKPTYDILKENSDFQLLQKTRLPVLSDISDLKATLADRIRDPKRLRDLVSR